MRCISLDFVDKDLIDPAYAYKINVGYILSDYLDIIGHTVFLLTLERRFPKMSLLHKAGIVAAFQKSEPEAKKAFEDFFVQQKQKNSVKHLPTNLFVLSKKYELQMEKVVNEWILLVQTNMRKAGYFSFYYCFDKGIFENHSLVETREEVKGTLIMKQDIFENKAPIDGINKMIWLLTEGFFNDSIYEEAATTNLDLIEDDKPYLIKCLDLPNLNTLTSPEMGNLKDQVNGHITLFKAEAEVWATKCYSGKDNASYFKEHLFPTMQSVQTAIENDSILKQWSNMDIVKKTSAVYFGTVSPSMLWKYYKNALIIKPALYDQLMANYLLGERYTIPVMVSAYSVDALILETDPVFDGATFEAILSVKKHIEVS